MMQHVDKNIDVLEVRRLLSERSLKKAELDALDKTIDSLMGISEFDRPRKPRLSNAQVRAACNVKK